MVLNEKNLTRIRILLGTPSWEIANLIRIKEGRVPWPVVRPGGIYGDSGGIVPTYFR